MSGGLEAEILAALWASQRPLTTTEVVDALGGDLAYTTVQTVLTRLHVKGAVDRSPAGRAHAYTPVLDREGLAAVRMHGILDQVGDSGAVLSRFVGILSSTERAALTELMRHAASDGGED
jgi:predicted transcriptional regulator